MAASSTVICNLALVHLGQTKGIANLSTEQSKEAALFRTLYETVRNLVLRDHAWPFAKKTAELNLVEEEPNDEWAYSYRYPTDCLNILRIQSSNRNDTRASRVPYQVGKDSTGLLVYCDREEAVVEYIEQVTDTTLYPNDFTMALSYRLASYAAPAMTSGDPFNLQEKCMNMYRLELSKATSNAFNEQQDDELPEAELIRFRE
jgi:hypothetical protein